MLYHVCHALGRFPYELPVGLPDEQIELMFGYMQIVAEIQSQSSSQQTIARARVYEAELQRSELEAWKGVSR